MNWNDQLKKVELKILYLISMPIGNLEDISKRGWDTLQSVPTIVVEEYRTGKKILEQMGIDLAGKKILQLNEHVEKSGKLSTRHITKKKAIHSNPAAPFGQLLSALVASPSAALISDAGAPILADPGFRLLKEIHRLGIAVTHIPGGSSLVSGLLLSKFPCESFYYLGFLPQNRLEREKALNRIRSIPELLVIMETPYRLSSLLLSLGRVFHAHTPLAITFELTTDQEEVFHGKLKEAITRYGNSEKNRRAFVMFVDNRR